MSEMAPFPPLDEDDDAGVVEADGELEEKDGLIEGLDNVAGTLAAGAA